MIRVEEVVAPDKATSSYKKREARKRLHDALQSAMQNMGLDASVSLEVSDMVIHRGQAQEIDAAGPEEVTVDDIGKKVVKPDDLGNNIHSIVRTEIQRFAEYYIGAGS